MGYLARAILVGLIVAFTSVGAVEARWHKNESGGGSGFKKKRGGMGDGGGGSGGGFGAGGADMRDNPMSPQAPREVQEKAGLFNTGLIPIYPTEAECLEIKSFFGDKTRYDGSRRVQRANHGYHSGADISSKIGTPLIALADGEVVHKYSGGRLVGHQIILRHSPEETGLPVWIFSKYKHFDHLPNLAVGEKVKLGQVLGPSGASGTRGGHYGDFGYPHLHVSIYANTTGVYRSRQKGAIPEDVYYLDPVAIYMPSRPEPFNNHAIKALPAEAKKVPIPYMTPDGEVVPARSKLIWPYACARR